MRFDLLTVDRRVVPRDLAHEGEQIGFGRSRFSVPAVQCFLDVRQIDAKSPLRSQQAISSRHLEYGWLLRRRRQRGGQEDCTDQDRTELSYPASQGHGEIRLLRRSA